MRKRHFAFFALLTGLLSTPANAQEDCVSPETLHTRSIIVEKYGRGAGSGVLLNKTQILTAYHVVDDIEKIWVRLPGAASLPVPAHLTRYDTQADIALLTLEQPLSGVTQLPILHGEKFYPKQRVYLASYAFADRSRFGIIEGSYVAPARLGEDLPVTASLIELTERTYGGDSGGGIFTCYGELAGIEIGNQAQQGNPRRIAAVAPGYLHWVLLTPGK